MKPWAIVGAITFVTLCFPGFAYAEESQPLLYFEEVQWAGSSSSSYDEWFELKSTADTVLLLDDWVVKGAGSKDISLRGLQIAPHGSLLVARYDQHHKFSNGKESILAIDPDSVQSSLSLNNEKLQLTLFRADEIIDIAGSGGLPPTPAQKPAVSMVRNTPVTDGTAKTSWSSSITRSNLDLLATEFANPTNAGRPTIGVPSTYSLPIQATSMFHATVTDPDGEDDISTVSLQCSESAYQLVDNGLSGDQTAGDGIFTSTLHVEKEPLSSCMVQVVDSSGLHSKSIVTISTYVENAPIRINELYPASGKGEEEFIELINDGNTAITLNGWQLDDRPDGGSNPFRLEGITIPANGYVVFYARQTKLALNNDGDRVVLINPLGAYVDDAQYTSAPSHKSWGRSNSEWEWQSTKTPGSKNVSDEKITPIATVINPSKETAPVIALANVRSSVKTKKTITTRVTTKPINNAVKLATLADTMLIQSYVITVAELKQSLRQLSSNIQMLELRRWIRFNQCGILFLLVLLFALQTAYQFQLANQQQILSERNNSP